MLGEYGHLKLNNNAATLILGILTTAKNLALCSLIMDGVGLRVCIISY